MTSVTIRGLSKYYGDNAAVDNLKLEIADGELISLLGPSGCGKTTTLRSIAGFVQPDTGTILFDDKDITDIAPERRDIGMVFQNYALFPHMTVQGNLQFGLEMRKIPKKEMGNRIEKVLEIVQLTGMQDRYPRQLSGGQQQRVALARALVIEPQVLLLDEPLANLDAKLREEMRFFIRSLQKRIGITTVYVTHDQAEAMVMSDRIVVMSDGRIAQLGSAMDIYARPASRDIADFIGLSNFIAGRVKQVLGQGSYILDTNLGEIRCRSDQKLMTDDRAVAVLRPETIRLSPNRPTDPSVNIFIGRITERFYQGNLIGYRVACTDGTIVQVQEQAWHEGIIGEDICCTFQGDQTWIVRK